MSPGNRFKSFLAHHSRKSSPTDTLNGHTKLWQQFGSFEIRVRFQRKSVRKGSQNEFHRSRSWQSVGSEIRISRSRSGSGAVTLESIWIIWDNFSSLNYPVRRLIKSIEIQAGIDPTLENRNPSLAMRTEVLVFILSRTLDVLTITRGVLWLERFWPGLSSQSLRFSHAHSGLQPDFPIKSHKDTRQRHSQRSILEQTRRALTKSRRV